jgi:hypothetical protein
MDGYTIGNSNYNFVYHAQIQQNLRPMDLTDLTMQNMMLVWKQIWLIFSISFLFLF